MRLVSVGGTEQKGEGGGGDLGHGDEDLVVDAVRDPVPGHPLPHAEVVLTPGGGPDVKCIPAPTSNLDGGEKNLNEINGGK